jgi:hypothetical protein
MMNNRTMETHPFVINVTPQPFKDPVRITTKIVRNHNEHTCKMDMPPCGLGLEAMSCHMHEFSSHVENLETPPENERACFALFQHSLTTNSLSGARVGWDEVFENRGDEPPGQQSQRALSREKKGVWWAMFGGQPVSHMHRILPDG